MRIPICLLTPNNFAHKAGDGTKTRKREVRFIHPALQANCGATQATYLLERWVQEINKEIIQIKDNQYMDLRHTELPCFYDDRDIGWGRKRQIFVLHKEQVGVE